MRLTREPGRGGDRRITEDLKPLVITRLSLGTCQERTREGNLIDQEVIGFGSGDLQMMYDADREWFGSFAEYSGGQPQDVDLDIRLGRKRQRHEDIPHAHEILASSLEHHEDNQCVFRALAELTGSPLGFIRAKFETIADRLEWGACPSHVEEWCKRRGLGMRWLVGKRLMRRRKPDLAVFRETQTGRP